MELLTEESDSLESQLLEVVGDESISMDVITVAAGDRDPAPGEEDLIARMKETLGRRFYSELLFMLSNEYFSHELAEDIWKEILRHKLEISGKLGRNVGISVAALDYLTNVRRRIHGAKIIAEPKMKQIIKVAMHDHLTGLFGRAVFDSSLKNEMHRHSRYGNVVSLIMIDIDDFKKINDRFGHRHGDDVLRGVSETINASLREVDIPCRYGGEEFAVILPQTSLTDAEAIAWRICTKVCERYRPDSVVTISLGVANCPGHADSADGLIDAADRALYISKSRGKNQVSVACITGE